MGYATVVKLKEEMERSELIAHETKRHSLFKFILLLIILIAYFIFVTREYGAGYGLVITALTWSFFVLCTPVADAGFLVDFPIRIFANVRMFQTEIVVWVASVLMNVIAIATSPEIYEKTFILKLFQHILLNPYPFWGIILLSSVGTFLSIFFGDELMDVVSYKHRTEHPKHKLKLDFILFLFVILAVIIMYDFLLKELGVDVPL